jgi:DNA-binding protein YbaB
MTQSPFGAEGFDLGAMLEQAQQMQNQLLQAQNDLAAQSVSGTAGGVSVTLSGVGEVTGVAVVPGTFEGSDPDSLSDLGDLVVAAYRDAKTKVDALAAATLGPLSGGLGGLGELGG